MYRSEPLMSYKESLETTAFDLKLKKVTNLYYTFSKQLTQKHRHLVAVSSS